MAESVRALFHIFLFRGFSWVLTLSSTAIRVIGVGLIIRILMVQNIFYVVYSLEYSFLNERCKLLYEAKS